MRSFLLSVFSREAKMKQLKMLFLAVLVLLAVSTAASAQVEKVAARAEGIT